MSCFAEVEMPESFGPFAVFRKEFGLVTARWASLRGFGLSDETIGAIVRDHHAADLRDADVALARPLRAGASTTASPQPAAAPGKPDQELYLRTNAGLGDSFPPFAFFRSKFGFVPNIFRAQTLRPEVVEVEARAIDHRRAGRLYRTLVGLTGRAEDALQSVFLKAFEHFKTFGGRSRLTWRNAAAAGCSTTRPARRSGSSPRFAPSTSPTA